MANHSGGLKVNQQTNKNQLMLMEITDILLEMRY